MWSVECCIAVLCVAAFEGGLSTSKMGQLVALKRIRNFEARTGAIFHAFTRGVLWFAQPRKEFFTERIEV